MLRVLAYHRIDRRGELGVNTISPRRFRSHLRFLEHVGLREGSLLPPKPGVCFTFDDGYANFAEHAWPALQEYGWGAALFPVAAYVGKESRWDSTWPRARHLGWRQLRQLAQEGVEIGAHTMTHPFLTRLPSEAARAEIADSKKALEDGTGRAVRLFAYPYGDVSDAVARMAEEAGFEAAYTMNPFAPNGAADRFELPRMGVYSIDGRRRFAAKTGARGFRAWKRAARFNQFINRCSYANRLLPRLG